MVLIEINHLVKKYGEHVAVDDLTLTVEPGKSMVFSDRMVPENPRQ